MLVRLPYRCLADSGNGRGAGTWRVRLSAHSTFLPSGLSFQCESWKASSRFSSSWAECLSDSRWRVASLKVSRKHGESGAPTSREVVAEENPNQGAGYPARCQRRKNLVGEPAPKPGARERIVLSNAGEPPPASGTAVSAPALDLSARRSIPWLLSPICRLASRFAVSGIRSVVSAVGLVGSGARSGSPRPAILAGCRPFARPSPPSRRSTAP